MLGIHELWLFVLSGLMLNVVPGPDTAYIVGRSIQLGWRGGAAAAIGISCGCLVHVFGAAIGLSALLMASSAAFAARAAGRIRQSQGVIAWINRALGGMFVYLGVRVAMLQAR